MFVPPRTTNEADEKFARRGGEGRKRGFGRGPSKNLTPAILSLSLSFSVRARDGSAKILKEERK